MKIAMNAAFIAEQFSIEGDTLTLTWVSSDSPSDGYVDFNELLDDVLDTPSGCVGRQLLFANGLRCRIKAHVNGSPLSSWKVDASVASLRGNVFRSLKMLRDALERKGVAHAM